MKGSDGVLSTKIHPPRLRADLLARPRLHAALADLSAPLVLVTGPAGSGKTVLVRQWLDWVNHPCVWLTVDPRDNDPSRFWAYFAGALSVTLPGLAWSPGERVTAELLETLAEELGSIAPLLVVLDDLHFLVEAEVLEQLGQLVHTLPRGVRLVLVSRAVPQLRLARRRAAGELVEVRGRDLLFTSEETGQVLGRPGQDPLAVAVQDSTGGWPVAVGFASLLPEQGTGGVAAPPTARSRRQIADYLTEEVLRAQPDELQDFLLDTSILDEITVSAADAVRGANDAIRHLHYLERHDVFLTQLDGTGVDTWRHHALVRDHLRQTLQRSRLDRWTDLHALAARYYATTDLGRAIGHALTAPDPELAADLIEAGMGDFPRGLNSQISRWQLLRWFEALPDRILGTRDALRSTGLALAASSSSADRIDLVDRWIAARPPGSAVALEELFTEAWRADAVGDMPRCRDACRRALALCEPGSVWWYTIHGGLADSEYMTGNWARAAEAFAVLQRPLTHLPDRGTGVIQEHMRAFSVVIRCRQGDLAGAAALLGELNDWLAEVAGLGHQSCGAASWAEAMVAFYAGDAEKAARWDTLPENSEFGPRLCFLVFRLDLARVRRAAGDTARAAQLLAEVRDRLADLVDPGQFPNWVSAEEAALGISGQSPAPAAQLAETGPSVTEPLSAREREVMRLLRSEFSLPEIASHLFVSYNTAKTHTRTIYRKLGVRSRSAAVARARALGYL